MPVCFFCFCFLLYYILYLKLIYVCQEHPDDYHQANLEAFTYERVAKTEVKTKLYNVAIFKYFGTTPSPSPSPLHSLLRTLIYILQTSLTPFLSTGNNEACLAAFDINGGIHLYTLLDLTRVHSISYQATNVRYTFSLFLLLFICFFLFFFCFFVCFALFVYLQFNRFTPGPEGVIYGMHPEGVLKASVFAAEFR